MLTEVNHARDRFVPHVHELSGLNGLRVGYGDYPEGEKDEKIVAPSDFSGQNLSNGHSSTR